MDVREITPQDAEWPIQLADLADAPARLWIAGAPLPEMRRCVAIVGARAATAYGLQVAADLAADLAEGRRRAIVSGMALGIDGAAHRGALTTEGHTVAVLPTGIDIVYPLAHARLVAQVAEAGTVVSEYEPGTTPTRANFLSRNRLIAALSAGTVVVEAAPRSGSLSTARWAHQLGRVLMAVPGPVTSPMSAGCHNLIADGRARLVTSAPGVAHLVGSIEGAGVAA